MGKFPILSGSLSAATLASLQQLTLSGLATGYDPATRTVQVQGVRVTIDASAKVDVGALARGEFVSLQINTGAGTGTNGTVPDWWPAVPRCVPPAPAYPPMAVMLIWAA